MNTQDELGKYLTNIWNDFILLNPPAKQVHTLLAKKNENVINDHIAFRTFANSDVSARVMAGKFAKFGYFVEKEYDFPTKNLKALHMEHFDVSKPKIFISEIDISKLSGTAQKALKESILQITPQTQLKDALPYIGRPWDASYKMYKSIYAESEYAAWLYAHGFRPNHFTIFVNELKYLNDIRKLNEYLKESGFKLNDSGGEVKGSPLVYLEQSSTMAAPIVVKFKEGVYEIPGGYYEFAKRYPQKNNKIFQGFVAESADKIFESTNRV